MARLAPATWHEIKRQLRLPDDIEEQRFIPAPRGSRDVTKFYPIEQLIDAIDYLLKVQDRMLPVAFFAEPRYGFATIIGMHNRLKSWKRQGYTDLIITHGPDLRASIHQPFMRYYIWQNRLKTMTHMEPVRR